MRAVLVVAALVALAPVARATDGEVYFPLARFKPVGDPFGSGYISWSLNTRPRVRTFCWSQLAISTRSQALYAYIRRGAAGPIVATIDLRPHSPLPWQGSGSYSGCMQRPRALVFDMLRRPGRYFVDVRTSTHRHAIRARLHGPPL